MDENLNRLTGVWWARELKLRKKTYYGRGDHYNHSSYADLAITGYIGLRPRADDVVEVKWFALDRVPCHGHDLGIVWDKTGDHFREGQGLRVFSDGREIAHSPTLAGTTGRLSEMV